MTITYESNSCHNLRRHKLFTTTYAHKLVHKTYANKLPYTTYVSKLYNTSYTGYYLTDIQHLCKVSIGSLNLN